VEPVIWLDLETTGLDPVNDKILELAMVNDETGEKFQAIVSHDGQGLSPFILDMHTKVSTYGPENLTTLLRAVPPDHKVFGYFVDMRPLGPQDMTPLERSRTGGTCWCGCLLFVFECPHGVQGKAYGT
jgi:hypothetical protein